jgi:RNA polymerase sigma-70 factor, ECF subfamily
MRRDDHVGREMLAALYDAHADQLYRYALMITANAVMAEDAIQQVFVKLAAMGTRVEELRDPAGYLRVAVRNECYRLLKRSALLAIEEQLLVDREASVEAVAEDRRRAVEAALRALPAEQREVVHMKVYEQMTFQQIADVLGIRLNTAASRYRYGLEKLRELLRGYERDA